MGNIFLLRASFLCTWFSQWWISADFWKVLRVWSCGSHRIQWWDWSLAVFSPLTHLAPKAWNSLFALRKWAVQIGLRIVCTNIVPLSLCPHFLEIIHHPQWEQGQCHCWHPWGAWQREVLEPFSVWHCALNNVFCGTLILLITSPHCYSSVVFSFFLLKMDAPWDLHLFQKQWAHAWSFMWINRVWIWRVKPGTELTGGVEWLLPQTLLPG